MSLAIKRARASSPVLRSSFTGDPFIHTSTLGRTIIGGVRGAAVGMTAGPGGMLVGALGGAARGALTPGTAPPSVMPGGIPAPPGIGSGFTAPPSFPGMAPAGGGAAPPVQMAGVGAGVPAVARAVGGLLARFYQGSMQFARAFLRDRRQQAIAAGAFGAGSAARLLVPGDGENGTVPGCPSGYRLNKSDYFLKDGTPIPAGSVCVKIRRRNPLNPRAADRAIGRLESAKRAVQRLNRITIRKRKC